MKKLVSLFFYVSIDILLVISIFPLICDYKRMEIYYWLLIIVYLLINFYLCLFRKYSSRKKKNIIATLVVVTNVLLIGFRMNAPIRSKIETFGIEHYEIEYFSSNSVSMRGQKNYEAQIDKYSFPQLTTIKQLKEEFSFDGNKYPVSIRSTNIDLDDDAEVWAYVSVYRNYVVDSILFVYNNIEFSVSGMTIDTDFKVLKRYASSAGKNDIVVLSIIPTKQFE